eukprot:6415070-Amphidinium_carterae.2
MKGKGLLLRIAREVALIQAWSELALRVEHLPACENELADALSRLQAQPCKSLPAELARISQVVAGCSWLELGFHLGWPCGLGCPACASFAGG